MNYELRITWYYKYNKVIGQKTLGFFESYNHVMEVIKFIIKDYKHIELAEDGESIMVRKTKNGRLLMSLCVMYHNNKRRVFKYYPITLVLM